MEFNDKNLLLDKLSVCYNRANYLKAVCEERAMPDAAAQFARRRARLRVEIDGLLRDLYQAWIGEARALKGRLDAANKGVEQAVKGIEKDIQTAANIAKAIGYIDDVVKMAADLVA